MCSHFVQQLKRASCKMQRGPLSAIKHGRIRARFEKKQANLGFDVVVRFASENGSERSALSRLAAVEIKGLVCQALFDFIDVPIPHCS